jgi:Fic family protein
MDKFQKKINFYFKANQQIICTVSQIDSFSGIWNLTTQKEHPKWRELRHQTMIRSAGSSCRIEGAQMSNQEIAELMEYRQDMDLRTQDQQDVAGYLDVLQEISAHHTSWELSRRTILELHLRLLRHSPRDARHRGTFSSQNTRELRPAETEMAELITWTNHQLQAREIHPLIVIGLFAYELLSIHPFTDGCGRLSRLLTTLLLLRNQYFFVEYVPFEELLEKNRDKYFDVLRDAQKHRNTESERIESFILFFLNCLKTLTVKLQQGTSAKSNRSGYLNERQKRIRDYIRREQPVKLSDLARGFPEESVNTLKKDLQFLRSEQILSCTGKNRGAVYSMEPTAGVTSSVATHL